MPEGPAQRVMAAAEARSIGSFHSESGFHFSPVFKGNYNRCINHSPMKAAFLVPSFLRISGKTIHVSYRPVQNWRPPTYRSCLFRQTFSLPFVQGVENEDLFSE